MLEDIISIYIDVDLLDESKHLIDRERNKEKPSKSQNKTNEYIYKVLLSVAQLSGTRS